MHIAVQFLDFLIAPTDPSEQCAHTGVSDGVMRDGESHRAQRQSFYVLFSKTLVTSGNTALRLTTDYKPQRAQAGESRFV